MDKIIQISAVSSVWIFGLTEKGELYQLNTEERQWCVIDASDVPRFECCKCKKITCYRSKTICRVCED